MLLLARTGMRAAEVARLSLDDVDWACGIIHIREAKTRRDRDLPLSRDVGRALLAYLKRERPPSSHRTIFLQAIPPSQPFSDSSAISKIVRRALIRADIAPARGAAHLIRHAVATTMLTRGSSFKNIHGGQSCAQGRSVRPPAACRTAYATFSRDRQGHGVPRNPLIMRTATAGVSCSRRLETRRQTFLLRA